MQARLPGGHHGRWPLPRLGLWRLMPFLRPEPLLKSVGGPRKSGDPVQGSRRRISEFSQLLLLKLRFVFQRETGVGHECHLLSCFYCFWFFVEGGWQKKRILRFIALTLYRTSTTPSTNRAQGKQTIPKYTYRPTLLKPLICP